MFFKAKLWPICFSYLMAVFSLMFYVILSLILSSSHSEVLAILKESRFTLTYVQYIFSNVDFSIYYGPPVPGSVASPERHCSKT